MNGIPGILDYSSCHPVIPNVCGVNGHAGILAAVVRDTVGQSEASTPRYSNILFNICDEILATFKTSCSAE